MGGLPVIDAPHHAVDGAECRPSLTLSGEAAFLEEPARGGALTEGGLMAPGHHKTMSDRVYRRLTVAECLALQGFPPGFKVLDNQTQQYRIVGNGVCPPVAEALGRSVKEVL